MAADIRTIALAGIRAARAELCRADGLLLRAIEVAATHGIEAKELARAAGTSVERIDRIVQARGAAGPNARDSRSPRRPWTRSSDLG